MVGQAFKRRGTMTLARPPLKRRARSRLGVPSFNPRHVLGAGRIHRGREYKFFEELFVVSDLDTGGTNVGNGSMVEIPQGITESTRIGRKIVIKSLAFKGRFRLDSSGSGVGNNLWRMIVFQDKQCNGAAAAVLDILEQADLLSFHNLANSSRFRILYDRTRAMNPTAGAGESGSSSFNEVHQFVEFILPMNIPIEYDNSAATGAIATIRSNNIGILVIENETANVISLSAVVRVRFSDN